MISRYRPFPESRANWWSYSFGITWQWHNKKGEARRVLVMDPMTFYTTIYLEIYNIYKPQWTSIDMSLGYYATAVVQLHKKNR